MSSFLKTFKVSETAKFFSGQRRNAWVKDGAVCVYLRLSQRYVNGTAVTTFEIANINVVESKQNNGHFKAWYDKAEFMAQLAGIQAMYVENVLNPVMDGICLRRGFQLHHKSGANCYVKVFPCPTSTPFIPAV